MNKFLRTTGLFLLLCTAQHTRAEYISVKDYLDWIKEDNPLRKGYVIGVFDTGPGRCAPTGLPASIVLEVVDQNISRIPKRRQEKLPAATAIGLIIQGTWRCKEA